MNGGENGGIGGGAADALLLQRLHQGGFGEAGRRLGEVLLGQQFVQLQDLAPGQGRQGGGRLFLGLVVPAFLIDFQKAVELQDGAGSPEEIGSGCNFHHGLIQ